MAERLGFEPRRRFRLHAFQACAFDHSAISPYQIGVPNDPGAPNIAPTGQKGKAIIAPLALRQAQGDLRVIALGRAVSIAILEPPPVRNGICGSKCPERCRLLVPRPRCKYRGSASRQSCGNTRRRAQ